MGERNPYEVLGVPRDAGGEEVRVAYRRKAKLLHPDVNPSPTAAEEFKELQAAYEMIGSGEAEAADSGRAADPRAATGPAEAAASDGTMPGKKDKAEAAEAGGGSPAGAASGGASAGDMPDAAEGCLLFFAGLAFPPFGIVTYFDERSKDKYGLLTPGATASLSGALINLLFVLPIILFQRFGG